MKPLELNTRVTLVAVIACYKSTMNDPSSDPSFSSRKEKLNAKTNLFLFESIGIID